MTKYTVIGRTSPACKYCDESKELLDALGIEYEFIDLTGNDTALMVFKAFGYSAVPIIIDDNGAVIGGYDKLSDIFAKKNAVYMRDNHTFKKLSSDADTAINQLYKEFVLDGYSYGMLGVNGGDDFVHGRGDWEKFKSDAIVFLNGL